MSPKGLSSMVSTDVVDIFTTAGRTASATSDRAMLRLLSVLMEVCDIAFSRAEEISVMDKPAAMHMAMVRTKYLRKSAELFIFLNIIDDLLK